MRDPVALRAAATPAATALVPADAPPAVDTDRPAPAAVEDHLSLTYGGLDDAVEALAGRLAATGIEPDDHVAILGETGSRWVQLFHATIRVGATAVPISTRLVPDEVCDRVERSDIDLVVTTLEAVDTVQAAVQDTPVTTVGELPDPEEGDWPDRSPTATVLIMFTSGTTGHPKAVCLSLANLLASAGASAVRLGVLPDDTWYVPLPVYHMGGLAPIVRSTLYGTTVVLERGGPFEPERTLARMRAHRPTGVSLVPTMLRRLLDAGELPESLRFVLLGGAPTPDDLVWECDRRGIPVCPTYGMTEAASQIATARPDEAVRHVGTVGRPLLGTTLTIVDDDEEPVGPDESGELVVAGPTVTAGYYGDEAATAAAFGEYGLHTGDVGYRDDAGRLWILNRRIDRIITGGENVDPGEVVSVLEGHPDVEAAAVVGLPDPEWGERVGALVVGDADPSGISSHCRDRLADFKRPRTIAFVAALPRTPSGTVDREAVRAQLVADGQSL